jgi:hypothetical protein
MAHLGIALLGPFDVVLDGKRVAWFQSDKARALLAYLAAEAASPHARHTLAGTGELPKPGRLCDTGKAVSRFTFHAASQRLPTSLEINKSSLR